MQKLKPEDFAKVKRFIDKETKSYTARDPIVKELSSTELYIGSSRIIKTETSWDVETETETIHFNSKRNAMYYAFLFAFENKKLISELLSIDQTIGIQREEITRLKHILNQPATRKDSWKIGLYHNKLSEAVARYQKAKNDMHNWMDYAKYIN